MKTTNRLAILLATVVSVSFSNHAWSDTFGSGANTFDIEFVTIGSPGNLPDTTGNPKPAGTVLQKYRIGKFEISEQMIAKANAEGGLGITKNTRGPNKPATNVSWNEAARFMNWLNTSTGYPPAYKFAVQPGEGGYNANANIQLWAISDAGYNPTNLFRNSLARYFLPSIDEWYKAAYYHPSSDSYFNFPTGSDTEPAPVASGTAAGTAVYNLPFTIGPADITLAGGLSPYGTMGQGGNVYELQETDADLVNNSALSDRGIRGGYWISNSFVLSSLGGSVVSPTGQFNDIGFRVASIIPEPGTMPLVISGLALCTCFRRNLAT